MMNANEEASSYPSNRRVGKFLRVAYIDGSQNGGVSSGVPQ